MATADWLIWVTLTFACMQVYIIDLLICEYTRRTYRPRHHQVTSRYRMMKALIDSDNDRKEALYTSWIVEGLRAA